MLTQSISENSYDLLRLEGFRPKKFRNKLKYCNQVREYCEDEYEKSQATDASQKYILNSVSIFE